MLKDFWFADCQPCGYTSQHATQDEAIAKAEDHNVFAHRRNPEGQRGRDHIACVQQRTVVLPDADESDAPPTPQPTGAAAARDVLRLLGVDTSDVTTQPAAAGPE